MSHSQISPHAWRERAFGFAQYDECVIAIFMTEIYKATQKEADILGVLHVEGWRGAIAQAEKEVAALNAQVLQ